MRHIKNAGEIKSFVKKASTGAITDWLTSYYDAGLSVGRQEGYALAFDEMKAKVEEAKSAEANKEGTADGGVGTGDSEVRSDDSQGGEAETEVSEGTV